MLEIVFMNHKHYFVSLFIVSLSLAILSCETKKNSSITAFTRIDSLTEIYLSLQDSVLNTWNVMVKDDNQKITTMIGLMHELKIGGQFSLEELQSLEQRVEQLKRIRYTPQTMHNVDVIEEYDFASSSLVTELIAMAESHTAFSYNKVLQNQVEKIRAADLRVENFRVEYDATAQTYNNFIEAHLEFLKEIADNETLNKKPLFQIVSE